MAPQDAAIAVSAAPEARTDGKARNEGYLWGPWIDFLGLGGLSLITLCLVALFLPDTTRPEVAVMAGLLAHVVNHPHFAHSYQIFYRDYRHKAFGDRLPPALRYRYILSGIIVPVALIGFFAVSIAAGMPEVLGFGANLMFFFVGWHYVKQGYGMLMVDAVLKKRFFSDREKTVLRVNAYAGWIVAYLMANDYIARHDYWGLKYYTFATPGWLMGAVLGVAGGILLWTLWTLVRKETARRGSLPWIGLMAYVTSIYVWLFPRVDPIFILIIPAFHSLQYMMVVWRYQVNSSAAAPDAAERPAAFGIGSLRPTKSVLRLIRFAALGLVLGFLGFWGLPIMLDSVISYDHALFGTSMFLFMAWIFINVHHYFLDNVMWRRENPDIAQHLFSHGK